MAHKSIVYEMHFSRCEAASFVSLKDEMRVGNVTVDGELELHSLICCSSAARF